MGNLISTTPRLGLRGRAISGGSRDTLRGAGLYNRSSLAIEVDETCSEDEKEIAPLQSMQVHAAAWRTGVPSFQGLDIATRQRDRKSSVVSLIVHAGIAVGVLWFTLAPHSAVRRFETNVVPVSFKLYAPPPPPPPIVLPVAKMTNGGGGGAPPIEPTKSVEPRIIPKMQATAPQVLRFDQPKLAIEPTEAVNIPQNATLPALGAPESPKIALASQARAGSGGFGAGIGGGIGAGHGMGQGSGGGLMGVGGGVSAPQVIHSVQPEFTQEARQANLQGNVQIQLIVDSQGNPQNLRVTRHLGMGLDEMAIDAVKQYKFRPAMYQGHPVAVQIVIDVDFHLH